MYTLSYVRICGGHVYKGGNETKIKLIDPVPASDRRRTPESFRKFLKPNLGFTRCPFNDHDTYIDILTSYFTRRLARCMPHASEYLCGQYDDTDHLAVSFYRVHCALPEYREADK
ncbi:hypothetical protein A0H81_13246 [Grifola frondosa]|uniref:Uncharacterized protein n=1 Tax=Grifola frondosa TaxID=5627 RepID=A0A1C7LPQ1_GRIFR|nr:hypothetical protein A0H81_13246 [Grifola frondosa]